jgi:uncharacterized protein (TIGR02996 family)
MDHAAAFTQAILEDPNEDAHRLVFADWLDDQGDSERAEFIRVQVEKARWPQGHPQTRALAVREAALLERNRSAWAAGVADLVIRYTFCRGFIEEISLSAVQFLRRGKEILRLAPIRRVHLRSLQELMSLLHDRTHARELSRLLLAVRELDFSWEHLHDVTGQALLSLPELPQPRALYLPHCSLSAAGFERLADCPVLDQVTMLAVSAGAAGPEGLQALLHSPRLGQLTHLGLANARLGDRGIGVLAGSPLLPRLRRLSLGHDGLGEPGVRTLVKALAGAPLESLDLSFNSLGVNGLRALLPLASSLPHLTDLNLQRTDLGNPGARLLAEAPLLSRLLTLDLSLNRIGDPGGAALAQSSQPRRLLLLDLIYNYFGPQVRQAVSARFGAEVCLFER